MGEGEAACTHVSENDDWKVSERKRREREGRKEGRKEGKTHESERKRETIRILRMGEKKPVFFDFDESVARRGVVSLAMVAEGGAEGWDEKKEKNRRR